MRLSVFAERLGTVRQNVYKIFQKSSINTDQLGKIGEILDYDFFQHFRKDGNIDYLIGEPAQQLQTQLDEFQELKKELEDCRMENKILKERLKDKEEIIGLYKERLKNA